MNFDEITGTPDMLQELLLQILEHLVSKTTPAFQDQPIFCNGTKEFRYSK